MSESKRYCGWCDRETQHEHWKNSVMGDRANLAERVFEGLFTFGISELVNPSFRKCLRCGYTMRTG